MPSGNQERPHQEGTEGPPKKIGDPPPRQGDVGIILRDEMLRTSPSPPPPPFHSFTDAWWVVAVKLGQTPPLSSELYALKCAGNLLRVHGKT